VGATLGYGFLLDLASVFLSQAGAPFTALAGNVPISGRLGCDRVPRWGAVGLVFGVVAWVWDRQLALLGEVTPIDVVRNRAEQAVRAHLDAVAESPGTPVDP